MWVTDNLVNNMKTSLTTNMENLDKIIKQIFFYRIKVTFITLRPLYLSEYKGSAYRGWLFDAFRRMYCDQDHHTKCKKTQKSDACSSVQNCPCSLLFESPLKDDHHLYGKYTYPPRPYIIIPSNSRERMMVKDQRFSFEIILIGNGYTGFYDPLIQAFNKMSEIGLGTRKTRCKFLKAEFVSVIDQVSPDPQIISFDQLPSVAVKNRIKLAFKNPVRLQGYNSDSQKRGFVETKPSFAVLADNLARRIVLLGHLYCNTDWLSTDFVREVAQDVTIESDNLTRQNWIRHSGSKDMNMCFDGYVGDITYIGNLEQWSNLLTIGAWLHTGSVATFGLGKYSILDE